MFEIVRYLLLLKSNQTCCRVAPRQHVTEGCSNVVAEVADSTALQTSERRTGRDARRAPCMLNVRSSAKVGLEPEDGSQERTDPRDAGAGDACWEWRRHGACGWHRRG